MRPGHFQLLRLGILFRLLGLSHKGMVHGAFLQVLREDVVIFLVLLPGLGIFLLSFSASLGRLAFRRKLLTGFQDSLFRLPALKQNQPGSPA